MTFAAFADETIGAILHAEPLAYSGRCTGSPAPEIIMSAPASIAAFTCAL